MLQLEMRQFIADLLLAGCLGRMSIGAVTCVAFCSRLWQRHSYMIHAKSCLTFIIPGELIRRLPTPDKHELQRSIRQRRP